MAIIDHRQQAATLEEIRPDHVARYRFAAEQLDPRLYVIDAACGVGYGAAILADSGFEEVVALDKSPDAIAYGVTNWHRPAIRFGVVDIEAGPLNCHPCGAVSFETIEHLSNPDLFLEGLIAGGADTLIASVPNQAVLPFDVRRFPDHHRHYTEDEFAGLLRSTGWKIDSWHHQADADPGIIRPGPGGRTLIVIAEA